MIGKSVVTPAPEQRNTTEHAATPHLSHHEVIDVDKESATALSVTSSNMPILVQEERASSLLATPKRAAKGHLSSNVTPSAKKPKPSSSLSPFAKLRQTVEATNRTKDAIDPTVYWEENGRNSSDILQLRHAAKVAFDDGKLQRNIVKQLKEQLQFANNKHSIAVRESAIANGNVAMLTTDLAAANGKVEVLELALKKVKRDVIYAQNGWQDERNKNAKLRRGWKADREALDALAKKSKLDA